LLVGLVGETESTFTTRTSDGTIRLSDEGGLLVVAKQRFAAIANFGKQNVLWVCAGQNFGGAG
jgi:hypothetical protein